MRLALVLAAFACVRLPLSCFVLLGQATALATALARCIRAGDLDDPESTVVLLASSDLTHAGPRFGDPVQSWEMLQETAQVRRPILPRPSRLRSPGHACHEPHVGVTRVTRALCFRSPRARGRVASRACRALTGYATRRTTMLQDADATVMDELLLRGDARFSAPRFLEVAFLLEDTFSLILVVPVLHS